jgi:hypothetical protein
MPSTKKNSVQVFQDLYLRHPMGSKTIRSALLQAATGRWIHSDLKEESISDTAGGQLVDVIAFERTAIKGLPVVTLWMFEDGKGGYKVSNVVPIQQGQLGVAGYNAALVDFASTVVSPIIKSSGIELVLTSADQTIEGWTDLATASALKRFSSLANKSTGRSHPLDDERWLDFIISAHHGGRPLDTEQLSRWLIEVERWSDDIAHDLASDYSMGIALLDRFNRTR